MQLFYMSFLYVFYTTHVCVVFVCSIRLMYVLFWHVPYSWCLCCHTADVCVVLICAIRLMILFYACTHIRKRYDSCGTHENDTYMSMSMFVHRKKFMSRMAHMHIYSYLKNHLSVVFYVGTYFFNDRLHNDSWVVFYARIYEKGMHISIGHVHMNRKRLLSPKKNAYMCFYFT